MLSQTFLENSFYISSMNPLYIYNENTILNYSNTLKKGNPLRQSAFSNGRTISPYKICIENK